MTWRVQNIFNGLKFKGLDTQRKVCGAGMAAELAGRAKAKANGACNCSKLIIYNLTMELNSFCVHFIY